MSRRGQEMAQPFLIILFVFFLIVAIALLTLEKKRLQTERPELDQDLVNQEAHAFLMSLMRTKIGTDARLGDTNFADTLIMDSDGSRDQFLLNTLQSAIPSGTYVEIHLYYPNGRVVILRNALLFGRGVGSSEIILPGKDGNIRVLIGYSKEQLYSRYSREPPKVEYKLIQTTQKEVEKSEDAARIQELIDVARGVGTW